MFCYLDIFDPIFAYQRYFRLKKWICWPPYDLHLRSYWGSKFDLNNVEKMFRYFDIFGPIFTYQRYSPIKKVSWLTPVWPSHQKLLRFKIWPQWCLKHLSQTTKNMLWTSKNYNTYFYTRELVDENSLFIHIMD